MRLLIPALILLANLCLASTEVVPIKNRRPSNILAIMDSSAPRSWRTHVEKLDSQRCSFLPPGIVLTADDEASTIKVEGPEEGIAEMKRLLEEFDVKVARVRVTVTVRSKLDKVETTTTTIVTNNASWTMNDESSGVTVTVKPRINGDGTVSGNVELAADDLRATSVVRQKLGQPVVFRWNPDGKVTTYLQTSKSDAPANVEVKVSFDRIDDN